MISEEKKIVPLLASANFGASTDCDSINMAGFHKATFIFIFGACTGNVTLTPKSGAAAGTSTTAVPTKYALGGAAVGTAVPVTTSAASADVLVAWAASTSTIVSTATTKMLVVEIDASDMTDGEEWLTINLAATAGIVGACAILEPRYTKNRSDTALA